MLKTILKICFLSLCVLKMDASFANTSPDNLAVKKAYDGWCNAIGSAKGNASTVVQYYAPGAILLPTLSSKKLINTNGGLDGYFVKLTSLKGIHCIPEKSRIRIHDNVATNSGFYSFSFKDKNDKEKEITSRFTFVYKKMGDKWLIETHHSSKTPVD